MQNGPAQPQLTKELVETKSAHLLVREGAGGLIPIRRGEKEEPIHALEDEGVSRRGRDSHGEEERIRQTRLLKVILNLYRAVIPAGAATI